MWLEVQPLALGGALSTETPTFRGSPPSWGPLFHGTPSLPPHLDGTPTPLGSVFTVVDPTPFCGSSQELLPPELLLNAAGPQHSIAGTSILLDSLRDPHPAGTLMGLLHPDAILPHATGTHPFPGPPTPPRTPIPPVSPVGHSPWGSRLLPRCQGLGQLWGSEGGGILIEKGGLYWA